MLYHSLILSHIRYCITTLCNGQQTTLNNIQRIANKFVRLTFGLNSRDSVKEVMHTHSIMTVEQINQLEIGCFMFKYANHMLPKCFNDFLSKTCIDHTTRRNTRGNFIFYPSFCRLNLTKQRFKFKGTNCWNSLPACIRDSNSYNKFRRNYTNYLLQA